MVVRVRGAVVCWVVRGRRGGLAKPCGARVAGAEGVHLVAAAPTCEVAVGGLPLEAAQVLAKSICVNEGR